MGPGEKKNPTQINWSERKHRRGFCLRSGVFSWTRERRAASICCNPVLLEKKRGNLCQGPCTFLSLARTRRVSPKVVPKSLMLEPISTQSISIYLGPTSRNLLSCQRGRIDVVSIAPVCSHFCSPGQGSGRLWVYLAHMLKSTRVGS